MGKVILKESVLEKLINIIVGSRLKGKAVPNVVSKALSADPELKSMAGELEKVVDRINKRAKERAAKHGEEDILQQYKDMANLGR